MMNIYNSGVDYDEMNSSVSEGETELSQPEHNTNRQWLAFSGFLTEDFALELL